MTEEVKEQIKNLKIGDKVYYARIFPTLNIYDVADIKLRTLGTDYVAGIDTHDKTALLFYHEDFGKCVFFNRYEALEAVKDAELMED